MPPGPCFLRRQPTHPCEKPWTGLGLKLSPSENAARAMLFESSSHASLRKAVDRTPVPTNMYVRVCTHESVPTDLYVWVCTHESVPMGLYARVCTHESVHTDLWEGGCGMKMHFSHRYSHGAGTGRLKTRRNHVLRCQWPTDRKMVKGDT